MIRRNFMSLTPAAANVWQKMQEADHKCIGTFIQNQHPTAIFWVCNREPVSLTSAQRFKPDSGLLEDILSGQEEVWIYTDTAGASLTFTKKYNG